MHNEARQLASQGFAKIVELEGIRGLAACLIVFFHIPLWNSSLDMGIKNNGYLMVELFFVLSGFVISVAYGDKINTIGDLLRFQFLRFGRLYPVHLLFLLLFVCVEIAKGFASQVLGLEVKSEAFHTNSVSAIFQHLFLLQAIGPTNNAVTFNAPAWSISVEFYTYLIFGAIVFFGSSRKTFLFFLITSLSLVSLVSEVTFGFERLLKCTAGFFLGCLVARCCDVLNWRLPRHASVLFFFVLLLFLQLKTPHQYDIAIFPLSAALVGSLVLSGSGSLNIFLRTKFIVWLGSISYSLYMSHMLVIWVFDNILSRVLKRPGAVLKSGLFIAQASITEAALFCLAVAVVVLIVSVGVHRFIEVPMRIKSRRFAFSKLT